MGNESMSVAKNSCLSMREYLSLRIIKLPFNTGFILDKQRFLMQNFHKKLLVLPICSASYEIYFFDIIIILQGGGCITYP